MSNMEHFPDTVNFARGRDENILAEWGMTNSDALILCDHHCRYDIAPNQNDSAGQSECSRDPGTIPFAFLMV